MLSEDLLYAEPECRRGLRHKDIIGRRGTAFARTSVAWLGRIYPVSTEFPRPRGKRRVSDDSATIGPTNASKSFQKDVASGFPILNSLEQNDLFNPNFIIHRFIPFNLLNQFIVSFFFGNTQGSSPTDPNLDVRR